MSDGFASIRAGLPPWGVKSAASGPHEWSPRVTSLNDLRVSADRTFVMNDRRFDLRAHREDPVSLRWTDHTGEILQGSAYLADISRSGASIRAQHPVKVGTILSLGYQDKEFAGKVTHCASGASGYVLGVEFDDGYRWSPRAAK